MRIEGRRPTIESGKAKKGKNDAIRSKTTPYQKGDVIKGEVLRRTATKLSLMTEAGRQLEAKLTGEFPYLPGEVIELLVSDASAEELVLKPVYNAQDLSENKLEAILQHFNLKVTPENKKMIALMMEARLPINRQTLSTLTRMMHKYPDNDLKTFIFLLETDHQLNDKTIGQLMKVSNPNQSLGEQLSQFSNDVSQVSTQVQGMKVVDAIIQDDLPSVSVFQRLKSLAGQVKGALTGLLDINQIPISQLADDDELIDLLRQIKDSLAPQMGKMDGMGTGQATLNEKAMLASAFSDNQSQGLGVKGIDESVIESPLLAETEGDHLTERFIDLKGKAFGDLFGEVDNMALPKEVKQTAQKLLMIKITQSIIDNQLLPKQQNIKQPQDLAEHYDKVYKKLLAVLELDFSNPTEGIKQIMRQAFDIKESVEFMAKFNQQQQFIQLPFIVKDKLLNSQLFVIKPKVKQSGPKKQAVSALLQLDLLQLGHLDILIKKDKQKVTIDFMAEDDLRANWIRQKTNLLHQQLTAKGFQVLSLTSKKREKRLHGVSDFLAERPISQESRRSFDVKA